MLELVTAPTNPLELAEIKAHLRIDVDAEDALLQAYSDAAFDYAEQFTRRALATQTWDLFLDKFPAVISVPLPPLQSVTVTYTDTAGNVQTFEDFTVAGSHIVPGTNFPPTLDIPHAVKVRFVAGYPELPASVRIAMLLIVGDLYEHREAQGLKLYRNDTADALLWPYRAL